MKSSLDELIAGATARESWKTAESLSGSALERLEIDGERFVLKHMHVDEDWIQRVMGDVLPKPLVMWHAGLFDALPPSFEHTIVDVAGGLGRNGWGCAVLMRDVSDSMLEVETIPAGRHVQILDHMAELHAHFWGFRDTVGLNPIGNRYYLLTPLMARVETDVGAIDGVPAMVIDGWERAFDASAVIAKHVRPLLSDPSPLVHAQLSDPRTLIHSDWKVGNLGATEDGRTVLIDWAMPGEAPCTLDLADHLAVNCDLLPVSKEETISTYHDALRRRGVETEGWWDHCLELSLLGLAALMAWSKSGDELLWWEEHVERGARYLG